MFAYGKREPGRQRREDGKESSLERQSRQASRTRGMDACIRVQNTIEYWESGSIQQAGGTLAAAKMRHDARPSATFLVPAKP